MSRDVIEEVLNRNQSETGDLARILEVKVNARIMLTVNIDIADRLINGQIETVKHIQILENYQQIVQEPTHLGGAILDHAYIRKDFVKDFKLGCFVKCIYFSDHDAVQFKLSKT